METDHKKREDLGALLETELVEFRRAFLGVLRASGTMGHQRRARGGNKVLKRVLYGAPPSQLPLPP